MSPERRKPPRGGRPPRNNRPAQRGGSGRPARPVRRPATTQPAGPRPRFTNRAAILLVVFALLVISYASSMRAYLDQRSHIQELKAEIAGYQRDIRAAKTELERWKDPSFVEQQARARFGWVLPGETAYQVLDGDGKPLTGKDQLADPDSIANAPETPDAWWTKLDASLRAADHPEVLVKKPPPAGTIDKEGNPKP